MNHGFKIVLVNAVCALKVYICDKPTSICELSTLQKAKKTSDNNLRDIYDGEHSDKLITFTNINNNNCIR